MKMTRLSRRPCALPVLLVLAASQAWGAVPSAEILLRDVGYAPEEIASIKAGAVVRRELRGGGDRDLTTGFAFFVAVPPAALNERLKAGVLQAIDPQNLATATLSAAVTVDAFAGVELKPDTISRVRRYLSARPGAELNLSGDEIAGFARLGPAAAASDVEAQLRTVLLARYRAYRAQGLTGIVGYGRGGGQVRAPADEMTGVMKRLPLQRYAPAAWAAMMNYPASSVAGSEEVFRWEHFNANGVPTFALTHGLSVPDGGAFLVLQRQFYVSEGFNCAQAIAALLPVEGGTVVILSNHASTDQVEGFGSGIKRSIGRGLMASQLETLFSRLQLRVR